MSDEIETERRASIGVNRLAGDLERTAAVVVLIGRVVAALVDVREVCRFDRDVREERGDLALVLHVVAAAYESRKTVGREGRAEARIRIRSERHPTLEAGREHLRERGFAVRKKLVE